MTAPAMQLFARQFAETHPADAARVLEQASSAEVALFLKRFSPEKCAGILSQMSLAAAAETLSSMDPEYAATVAAQLPLGNAASLLRRMESSHRTGILTRLSEDRRQELERLLEYRDGTVGAAADPEVFAIPGDLTCEAAQRLLRRRRGIFHHRLYVVDRAHHLLGHLHVRDLVRSPPNTPVTAVMQPATVRLQAGARMTAVMSHPAWRLMDAAPVVDKTGVLLGILRHRQLRQFGEVSPGVGITGALVGLSELYWIGLSKFLPSTPVQDQTDHFAPGHADGGEHAR